MIPLNVPIETTIQRMRTHNVRIWEKKLKSAKLLSMWLVGDQYFLACVYTYCAKNFEKARVHLLSNLAGCQSICAQWESEPPPTDIEGEFLASDN